MRKENTAIRLKKIMEERGLRQIDILNLTKPYCKKYGIKMNKSDISQYCSGKTEPNQEKLFVLGAALNVNPVWLMGFDVSIDGDALPPYPNIHPISRRSFPVLGNVSCGEPVFMAEEKDVYIDAENDIKADFVLIAKGDSMIGARIHDGDIVFVRSQPTVENGEIAVVAIDDEATLKRFYRYHDLIVLRAENPAYKDMEFRSEDGKEIRILGKAVAFQSELL